MADLTTTGMIADIQRFSLHDGPGIRTTVFLKGCNLRCAWCHNPETVAFEPQFLLQPERCIGCGHCAEGCFSGARRLCGVERTVQSVLDEVLLDQPYYGAEGGITISGGEPMCQLEFTRALLQASREHGLHTALESNLCFPWEIAQRALEQCRLLMCDLKLWDREGHRRWTGAYNDHTKQNIQNAAELGIPVLLRTPVVPGVNDREDEIAAIARFAAGIPTLICYELLPYHPLGLAKGKLEHGFEPQAFEKPTAARMEELAWAADRAGVPVRIAGKAFNFGPQQESEGTA